MFVKQTKILLLLSLTFLKITPTPAEQNLNPAEKPIKNGANKTDVRDQKIVGGYRCSIKNYPFLVSLRHTKSLEHFCAGSLLSEYWILTALHCLQRRCERDIEVIAGSSYGLDPKKNSHNEALQFSTIAQCYFYPIADDLKFDVALARLNKPMRETDNVAFVSLPFHIPNENKSLSRVGKPVPRYQK